MPEPEIIYTQEPGGLCPVQTEGTINGHPFYFRSRGKIWAVYITEPGRDPSDWHNADWFHWEKYPGVDYEEPALMHGHLCYFSAGYANADESKRFIEKSARLWIAWLAQPTTKSIP